MWLMLLKFPNGVRGSGSIPKVDVVGSNPIARSAAFSRHFLRELRGSAQAFSGPIATLKGIGGRPL
jgi:hypothetical protein